MSARQGKAAAPAAAGNAELARRIGASNIEYGELLANVAHRAALLRSELAGAEMREQALQLRVTALEQELAALKSKKAPAAPADTAPKV